MIRFMRNTFSAFLTILICALVLIFSGAIFNGVVNSINLCLCTLIPSMYCFMVLANIIEASSLSSAVGNIFTPLAKYIFKINRECFTVFLLSLLGGYPVGARLIAKKVKAGEISLKTAQRMMYYCVNCSPAFLISGVSAVLWHNIKSGVIIYLSQVAVSFLFGAVTGLFNKDKQSLESNMPSKSSASHILVSSVNDATRSMIIICSYVLLFGGIFAFLDLLPIDNGILLVIKGFSEVTIGCQLAGGLPEFLSFIAVSAFTSFGGICVILQISAITKGSKINMFKFLISKVIYSLICTLVAVSIFLREDHSVECFSQPVLQNCKFYSVSPISSLMLIFLGIMMLFLSTKSAKIKLK